MVKSIFIFLFIFPQILIAETYELEKVVVGSKREMRSDEIVSGVDTLEDFQGKAQSKVIDELSTLPGISITQSGAPGQQSAIFIRGSEARHVLVIVDGVRMNDPSNTEKFFNASLLNLSDIEKIEVLKGSQSLLYGSEAIAGVINIVTKKGGTKNWVSATSGFSRGLALDNTLLFDKGLFHINAYHEESEGVSAATSGDEKDGFENKGVTINGSYAFSKRWEGDWTYKVLDQFVETDGIDSNDVPVDALGDYSKSVQQIFSLKLKRRGEEWDFDYLIAGNLIGRNNKVSGEVYNFNAIEASNELHWTKKTSTSNFLLGLENDSESFEQSGLDRKFAGLTSAVFIGDNFFGKWSAHYGIRAAYHTQYEEAFSPAIGISKRIGERTVGINYQRGFKSPTLYQLYGPDLGSFKVGNTDLDPETSDYIELSSKEENLELSLFYNKIDDFIQYDSSSGYINSSWIQTLGGELSFFRSLGKHTLKAGIFLAQYELSEGEKALRKPSEKATLNYNYQLGASETLSATYMWRGASFDNVNGELDVLEAFDTVDISYLVKDADRAQARIFIENVFNKTYETAYGYSNQPITFGLELRRFY